MVQVVVVVLRGWVEVWRRCVVAGPVLLGGLEAVLLLLSCVRVVVGPAPLLVVVLPLLRLLLLVRVWVLLVVVRGAHGGPVLLLGQRMLLGRGTAEPVAWAPLRVLLVVWSQERGLAPCSLMLIVGLLRVLLLGIVSMRPLLRLLRLLRALRWLLPLLMCRPA